MRANTLAAGIAVAALASLLAPVRAEFDGRFGDGDGTGGAAPTSKCNRRACWSIADDCCAPYDEAYGCHDGLQPVKTTLGCSVFEEGDFVCCEAGFTSEDVAAAGVEHNDDWHDDHRDEHSECPPEWVGGFKCVSRNDCQNNPFARVNPSACYTASWDGDELCCGQTEDACCQPEVGAIVGLVVGLGVGGTLIGLAICYFTKTCCWRKNRMLSVGGAVITSTGTPYHGGHTVAQVQAVQAGLGVPVAAPGAYPVAQPPPGYPQPAVSVVGAGQPAPAVQMTQMAPQPTLPAYAAAAAAGPSTPISYTTAAQVTAQTKQ